MGMYPILKLRVCCTEGAPLRWRNRWSGRIPMQARTLEAVCYPQRIGEITREKGWDGKA